MNLLPLKNCVLKARLLRNHLQSWKFTARNIYVNIMQGKKVSSLGLPSRMHNLLL